MPEDMVSYEEISDSEIEENISDETIEEFEVKEENSFNSILPLTTCNYVGGYF